LSDPSNTITRSAIDPSSRPISCAFVTPGPPAPTPSAARRHCVRLQRSRHDPFLFRTRPSASPLHRRDHFNLGISHVTIHASMESAAVDQRGLVLHAFSGLSVRYAASLGGTADGAILLAALGLCADVLAVILPSVGSRLWSRCQWAGSGMAWAIWQGAVTMTLLVARAFSGKVESGGIPKEARIRFKIPTGTRGPVMNGEAILR
jgi:hypothetical protein